MLHKVLLSILYGICNFPRSIWKQQLMHNLEAGGTYKAYYGRFGISIHTLSDLSDLSNLIGSPSRTIQQYSPPSEWIMCELGVFPILLGNDLLKVDKILGLTFLRQEKTSKDSKRRFCIYGSWILCSMDCLQLPFIRVEETVSWTQRFLTRKIWPKNRSVFMTNKFESKCFQKLYVSSK